jgi:NAD(P)-dependent dehydrogenase (short-subunit alcohol dehydrogenase family)
VSALLQGKVAIVTGSTQGLGAAVARLFAAHGAQVVITGRNAGSGESLAREMGPSVIFHKADLAKVDDCRGLVDAAIKKFGAVDVIVNSAADTSRSSLETFTPEHFDAVFHVNVRAPLLLAQRALPSMRQRNGVIINIGSVNAYIGMPNLLTYASSKGALMTASRNLGNSLQFERVRTFMLNVGWMDTEGEREVLAREGKSPDFLQTEGKKLPCRRHIRPEEVAQFCLLLASPNAEAFSGAVIDLEQFPIGALGYPTGR